MANLFPKEVQKRIVAAIEDAEANTSAEIRVHLENHCKGEVLDRAVEVFEELGMKNTELRNGVLIYIALKDHKMAIIGDQAVHQLVPKAFWEDCYTLMRTRFAAGAFSEGICETIAKLKKTLGNNFPHQIDDKNELPNELSFGN